MKELGDVVFEYGDTITLPTDGTGNPGDAVTGNGSGALTPVTATGDNIVGILSMAPADDGFAPVHMDAVPVANVAGSVTAFTTLVPDGSNPGRLTTAVGDGTDTTAGNDYPLAVCDAGGDYEGHTFGTNEAVVSLR